MASERWTRFTGYCALAMSLIAVALLAAVLAGRTDRDCTLHKQWDRTPPGPARTEVREQLIRQIFEDIDRVCATENECRRCDRLVDGLLLERISGSR
jgi:hypothetical protein